MRDGINGGVSSTFVFKCNASKFIIPSMHTAPRAYKLELPVVRRVFLAFGQGRTMKTVGPIISHRY